MKDGITYHLGAIGSKNVVFVNSGLGKLNSAIISTRLISDFHPSVILMSGSAGNLNPHLKKFDVVIGKEVANVDLGELTKKGPQFKFSEYLYNPQSHTILPMLFKLDNALIIQIKQSSKDNANPVSFGKIATSDALPNQLSQVDLLREAHFDVIEMEGASLMQSCWLFKTPCVVIRGISNNMNETITTKDIQIAADNAAKVVVNVISNL